MRRPRFPHNLKRLFRISLQNMKRNLFLSLATTVMLGLILFVFNVIMVLNFLSHSSLDQLAGKVDLILYLADGGSVYEISELISEVESIPVVTEVVYTSKDQALADFLEDYPNEKDPFSEYGLSNPLPANIQIHTEDPSHHQMVIDYLQSTNFGDMLTGVESSNENQEIVMRLIEVSNFTKKLSIGVVTTFFIGALLMLMNAIHLSIFTRKREIQIMQLVGATPTMIRLPFLFEGGLYSLIAAVFSFLLLLLFLQGTQLLSIVGGASSTQALQLFGAELISSIVLGVLSSFLAINFYLKRTFVLQK